MRKCPACGAALPEQGNAGVTRCSYCGTTTRDAAVPQALPAAPSSGRLGRIYLLFSAVGVVVVIGVVLVVGSPVLGVGSPLFSEWYSMHPCFIDANSDGIPDPVGFCGTPQDQNHLTALDGRTGKPLWRTKVFLNNSEVVCGDSSIVYVAQPNFVLEAFDNRGQARWSVNMGDGLSASARGPHCLAVKTGDRRTLGLADADGAQRACASIGLGVDDPTHDTTAHGEVGGRAITVDARTTGTPVLTVTVREGERVAWSKPVDAQVAGSRPSLAAIGKTVVVAGAEIGQRDHLVLTGFDVESGQVRYRRTESSSFSGRIFGQLVENGPFVLATWGYGLHAYDPVTGERVWHVGGR